MKIRIYKKLLFTDQVYNNSDEVEERLKAMTSKKVNKYDEQFDALREEIRKTNEIAKDALKTKIGENK